MLYQKPRMEILRIEERDVVITSLTGSGYNDEGEIGGDSTSAGGNVW